MKSTFLKSYAFPLFLLGVFAFMTLYKPLAIPPPWFDEGWTLITARNWVESGVYGIRLGDTWVTASAMSQPLGASFLVALSFKLFGVGLFQARMVMSLITVATLGLIFGITEKLYSKKSAWLAIFAILALAPLPSLQVLFVGREALGEIPMLFYLLAGYFFYAKAIETEASPKYIFLTALFWGLGIATKKQALPFWGASVALPFLLALYHKEKSVLRALLISGVSAAIVAGGLLFYEARLHSQTLPYGEAITAQLYQMAVWTTEPAIRKFALLLFAFTGLTSTLALLVRIPNLLSLREKKTLNANQWLELSLFVFVTSWLAWFLLGSLGWLRYYLPPHLIAAIFVGKLFEEWILNANLKRAKFWQKTVFFTIIALILYGFSTNIVAFRSATKYTDNSLRQLKSYLAENISTESIIESYESELFFLLPEYSFHFPPHSTQLELNHRDLFDPTAEISYSPFDGDFDYLITGGIETRWQLYKSDIDAGKLTLLRDFGDYQLYQHK